MKKAATIKWTAILLSLFMLMTMIPAIGVTAETADSDVLYTQDNIAVTGKLNAWAQSPAVNYTHPVGSNAFVLDVAMQPATESDSANVQGYIVKFGVGGAATEQITISKNNLVYGAYSATPAFDPSVAHTMTIKVYGADMLIYVDGEFVLGCPLSATYNGGGFTLHSRSNNVAAANTVFTSFTVSRGAELEFLHYEKSITPTGRLNTWSLAGTPNYTHAGNAVTFETTVAPKTARWDGYAP